MRVLVAGVGNIFRRDDGFGPEVARRLAGRWPGGQVDVVDYGIRGVHLAYDVLTGYDALVIADTVPGDANPGVVEVLRAGSSVGDEAAGLDAHSMDPAAVLAHVGVLGGELPPTYVIGCHPADLSDGIGLSSEVAAALDDAVGAAEALLEVLLSGAVVEV